MASISTRNLTPLPDVDSLKALLQSLAVLDSIMSPDEWDMRYFSFDAKWGRGEEMGSMRNGSGDDFFAFFNRSGCLLKGFFHESPMTPYREKPPSIWPGLLEDVPSSFSTALVEPAFSMSEITFCIWRLHDEKTWSTGQIKFPRSTDPDGSRYLLGFLDGKPKTYKTFAEDYYETELPIDASSAESVGRFWLRKFSELMKQSDLNVFKRLKAIGFSHGQFGFVVEALHNT